MLKPNTAGLVLDKRLLIGKKEHRYNNKATDTYSLKSSVGVFKVSHRRRDTNRKINR